jgi:hypothetical protein
MGIVVDVLRRSMTRSSAQYDERALRPRLKCRPLGCGVSEAKRKTLLQGCGQAGLGQPMKCGARMTALGRTIHTMGFRRVTASMLAISSVCWIALLHAAAPAAQPMALPTDKPISFSAIRITGGEDPHAYGPEVDLCKEAGTWSGFISEYTGFAADPPVGRLENLMVEESTGRISFRALLNVGVDMRSGKWVPARRIFEFSGRLEPNQLVGTMLQRPVEANAPKPEGEAVVFRLEPRDANSPQSCSEWKQIWNRVLEFRGVASVAEWRSIKLVGGDGRAR